MQQIYRITPMWKCDFSIELLKNVAETLEETLELSVTSKSPLTVAKNQVMIERSYPTEFA